MHFLGDNLFVYALGAVPESWFRITQKKAKNRFSLMPVNSADYDGLLVTYTF